MRGWLLGSDATILNSHLREGFGNVGDGRSEPPLWLGSSVGVQVLSMPDRLTALWLVFLEFWARGLSHFPAVASGLDQTRLMQSSVEVGGDAIFPGDNFPQERLPEMF